MLSRVIRVRIRFTGRVRVKISVSLRSVIRVRIRFTGRVRVKISVSLRSIYVLYFEPYITKTDSNHERSQV